jgi:prophage regulatory protein
VLINAENHPSRTLVRLMTVISITGLKRSSIYNRTNPSSKYYDPTFPKPVSLASSPGIRGAVAWVLAEVEAWVEARLTTR